MICSSSLSIISTSLYVLSFPWYLSHTSISCHPGLHGSDILNPSRRARVLCNFINVSDPTHSFKPYHKGKIILLHHKERRRLVIIRPSPIPAMDCNATKSFCVWTESSSVLPSFSTVIQRISRMKRESVHDSSFHQT